MRYLLYFTTLFTFIFLLSSCEETDIVVTVDETPCLNRIEIKACNNPGLEKDYVFEVTSDTVVVNLPKASIHEFVIDYYGTYDRVCVNGIEQVSGVTLNDFSEIVRYCVFNNSGDSVYYDIIVLCNNLIPIITISTEGGQAIESRDDYLNATIKIENIPGYNLEVSAK